MKEYTITLRRTTEIALQTMQYDFDKPHDFTFTPGQFAILDFPTPTYRDDRPTFRSLSIASAPHEDVLSFIMRNSKSAFKKNMQALNPGDIVTMKAPLGHMALPADEQTPVVFLAAGVGITPVRAMLRHAQHTRRETPMILFYANRTKASAACMDELCTSQGKNYTCINILSKEDGTWDGLRGRIDASLITQYVKDFSVAQFYVIGTTGFVNAMKKILQDLGVSDDQLHIDNFG